MFRIQHAALTSAALAAVLSLTCCPAALADTYTVYQVASSSGSVNNVGWADYGSLVTYKVTTYTYTIFTPPSTYVTSLTQPTLLPDSGSACTPIVPGLTTFGQGICNNGRTLFSAYSSGNTFPDLYLINTDASLQKLYHGLVLETLLGSYGDVAFIALSIPGQGDVNYLYYDTSTRITPEPGSLLLLETGAAGLAAMWWRRRRAAGSRNFRGQSDPCDCLSGFNKFLGRTDLVTHGVFSFTESDGRLPVSNSQIDSGYKPKWNLSATFAAYTSGNRYCRLFRTRRRLVS